MTAAQFRTLAGELPALDTDTTIPAPRMTAAEAADIYAATRPLLEQLRELNRGMPWDR
jgi:hypothetical protein